MILKLPIHYDANEWFVNVVIVLMIFIFAYLPKKLPTHQIVLIILFNTALGKMVDKLFGIAYPLDLYDTMDTPEYDLYDFLIYMIIYGLYGYFFVYFFVKMKLKQKTIALLFYLLLWVGMSTFFEWLSVMFGVFTYKRWNFAFSALAYFLIFFLQTFYFLAIEYYTKKSELS
jgi:hypothetical protein